MQFVTFRSELLVLKPLSVLGEFLRDFIVVEDIGACSINTFIFVNIICPWSWRLVISLLWKLHLHKWRNDSSFHAFLRVFLGQSFEIIYLAQIDGASTSTLPNSLTLFESLLFKFWYLHTNLVAFSFTYYWSLNIFLAQLFRLHLLWIKSKWPTVIGLKEIFIVFTDSVHIERSNFLFWEITVLYSIPYLLTTLWLAVTRSTINVEPGLLLNWWVIGEDGTTISESSASAFALRIENVWALTVSLFVLRFLYVNSFLGPTMICVLVFPLSITLNLDIAMRFNFHVILIIPSFCTSAGRYIFTRRACSNKIKAIRILWLTTAGRGSLRHFIMYLSYK